MFRSWVTETLTTLSPYPRSHHTQTVVVSRSDLYLGPGLRIKESDNASSLEHVILSYNASIFQMIRLRKRIHLSWRFTSEEENPTCC